MTHIINQNNSFSDSLQIIYTFKQSPFNLIFTFILFKPPQVHFSSLEHRSTSHILCYLDGWWLGYPEQANLYQGHKTELKTDQDGPQRFGFLIQYLFMIHN